MKSRKSIAAVALVLALSLAACAPAASPGTAPAAGSAAATATRAATTASPAAAPATPGAPYVVGFEGGLTGPAPGEPVSRLDGMRGYFYNLNRTGGVRGHPVNIVARDDTGTDIAKAVANLTEFQTQIKPSVIAGFTISTVADAVVQYADQYQIPFLGSSASPDKWKRDYNFASGPIVALQEPEVMVQFIKSTLKPGEKPRIALFVAATPAGVSFTEVSVRLIKAEGWDVVLNEPIPLPAPTEWLPQAQRVMSANADWAFGTFFSTTAIAFSRSLAQLGFKGKIMGAFSGSGINIMKQANNPNYYVTTYVPYLGNSAEHKLIADSVKSAGGDPTGDFVTAGWYTAAVVAKAFEACGFPCPGPAMKKALEGLGTIGNPENSAGGPLALSASDHAMVKFERVYRYVNGAIEAVSQPIPLGRLP